MVLQFSHCCAFVAFRLHFSLAQGLHHVFPQLDLVLYHLEQLFLGLVAEGLCLFQSDLKSIINL